MEDGNGSEADKKFCAKAAAMKRLAVTKLLACTKYYQTRLGARTNMGKSFCEGFFLGCVFRLNAV
jgi:hypothetical protein